MVAMNSPLPPEPCGWLPAAPPVLLVPGYLNSGPDHWQSHWEKRWPQVRRVDLGSWDAPDRELWQERFQAALQTCSEPPLVVAHSLGCLVVADHQARGALAPMAAALLVAPPDPGQPEAPVAIRGFGPVDRGRFKVPGLVVTSSNDPFAAEAFVLDLAQAWGLNIHSLGPCGHINADSGLGEWREGLGLLAELQAAAGKPGLHG